MFFWKKYKQLKHLITLHCEKYTKIIFKEKFFYSLLLGLISNRSFRDQNKSIYEYNPKNKTYNLKKDIIAPNDVPKKIDWK